MSTTAVKQSSMMLKSTRTCPALLTRERSSNYTCRVRVPASGPPSHQVCGWPLALFITARSRNSRNAAVMVSAWRARCDDICNVLNRVRLTAVLRAMSIGQSALKRGRSIRTNSSWRPGNPDMSVSSNWPFFAGLAAAVSRSLAPNVILVLEGVMKRCCFRRPLVKIEVDGTNS